MIDEEEAGRLLVECRNRTHGGDYGGLVQKLRDVRDWLNGMDLDDKSIAAAEKVRRALRGPNRMEQGGFDRGGD